jgi:branched-chain amino acid aminotransferase
VRMFRPDCNMQRFSNSMQRLAMPAPDQTQLLECIKKLLLLDASWIPVQDGYSIYIRPTAIGSNHNLGVSQSNEVKVFVILSPVGPYFKDGFKPVKLFADSTNVRAWPGGAGGVKIGGNYAPTIEPSRIAAEKHGCSQILWLFGPDKQITEVGSMNICFVLQSKDGKTIELVTPPLDRGDILPGVTRRSVLELTRHWVSQNEDIHHTPEAKKLHVSERWITIDEVVQAQKENRLLEVFGCGTAALLCPVKSIVYEDTEIEIPTPSLTPGSKSVMASIWKTISDIQYGRKTHPWSILLN